jgi:hypothetical protein
MSTTSNLPYGPGFDETTATQLATELAYRYDSMNALANYAVTTWSDFSAADIAALWAQQQGLDAPTEFQTQKANDFKAWQGTMKTYADTGANGDVGYQVVKWRNAGPNPSLR